MSDKDLELNIDIDPEQGKFDKLKNNILGIEAAWNKLSRIPTIEIGKKIKAEDIDKLIGVKKTNSFSAHREAVADLGKEEAELKKLTYTYDAVFKQQLAFVKDQGKKEKFLEMAEKEAFGAFRSAPASSTGKHHPAWANTEGGLVKHSKAVAQGVLGLSEMYGSRGNADDLILQALGHDMKKMGPTGLYNVKHAEDMARAYEEAGLEGSGVKTHMGKFKGGSKTAEQATTFEQKKLKESDWLNSRIYAQDYTKWNAAGDIESQDMPGLRKRAIKEGDAKNQLFSPFLKIVSEEEEKGSKAIKEKEKSWHSILNSAGKYAHLLKTLGALGVAAVYAGIKATSDTSATVQDGLSAFTDISVKDILDNEKREQLTHLAAGTINKEQQALQSKRGAFKTSGFGDFLPIAQLGQIGNMLLSSDPMSVVYGNIINELIGQVGAAKSTEEKDRLMYLIGQQMPAALPLVNFGVLQNQNWQQMGQRVFYNDSGADKAMGVDAEMQTYLNSIKNTWKQIFIEFQDLFGNKLLGLVAKWSRDFADRIMPEMNKVFTSITKASDYYDVIRGTKDSSDYGLYDKYVKGYKDAQYVQPSKEQLARATELLNLSKGLDPSGKKVWTNSGLQGNEWSEYKGRAERLGLTGKSPVEVRENAKKVWAAEQDAINQKLRDAYGPAPGDLYNTSLMAYERLYPNSGPVIRSLGTGMSEVDKGRMVDLMNRVNSGGMEENSLLDFILKNAESLRAGGAGGKDVSYAGNNVTISAIFPNATSAAEISMGIQQAATGMSTNNAMSNLYIGAAG